MANTSTSEMNEEAIARMAEMPLEDDLKEGGVKKHRRLQTYDLGKGNWENGRRGSLHGNGNGSGGNSHNGINNNNNNNNNNGNAVLAKYMASLSNEQRAELQKKSVDLRTERSIKRLELKLEEAVDQRNQATEIIKNLAKENEELKLENDELKATVQSKERDLKILERDYTLMHELFEEEKSKYEMEIQKMDKLKREMVEKEEELELRAKEQEFFETEKKRELDRHIKSFDGFEESESDGLNTPVEKKLYSQFQDEKRRTVQLKQQVDTLLAKLEEQSRMEDEFNQLKEYCNKLEQENAQQMDEASEVNASVHNEVIKLARRNAHLEQEKQELVQELENKEYKLSMLQKSLELSTHKYNPTAMDGVGDTSAMADEIYNAQKNELLYALDHEYESMDNIENTVVVNPSEESTLNSPDKESINQNLNPIPISNPNPIPNPIPNPTVKNPKPVFIPDVLKEYLNLTATAVKIKYPKVNIESEDLIKKVQGEQFFDYYERMVQIMQAEDAKARKPAPAAVPPPQESFFSRGLRKMFGVSSTPAPTATAAIERSNTQQRNTSNSIHGARNLRRKNTDGKEPPKPEKEKDKPLSDQPFRSVSPAPPGPPAPPVEEL